MQQQHYLNWHTHWDRAWYLSAEAYQHRLLAVLERVLMLLETHTLSKFSLDGQSVLLEDALRLAPFLTPRIKPLLQSGRLHIGPWYTAPDTQLIGLEPLVRNLRKGMRLARDWGVNRFTGYLPDTFGQPESIPGLLHAFNIHHAMVWRGRKLASPETESPCFYWQGPEGHRVLTYQLPEGYFHMPLQDVELPDDPARLEALNALAKRLKAWDFPVYLPMGGDHLAPPQEATLAHAKPFIEGCAVVHPHEFMQHLADATHNRPIDIETGSLRAYGPGCAPLLAGTLLSRPWLKYQNAEAEWAIVQVWEPLRALHAEARKRLNDTSAPLRWNAEETALEEAWTLLLLNQPHDDICGCGVDAIHLENEARFSRVLEAAGVWSDWHRSELTRLLGQPYVLPVERPPHESLWVHGEARQPFESPVGIEACTHLVEDWKQDVTQVPLSHRTFTQYEGYITQAGVSVETFKTEATDVLNRVWEALSVEWGQDAGDSYNPAPVTNTLQHTTFAALPLDPKASGFVRQGSLTCGEDRLHLHLHYTGHGTIEADITHAIHTPHQFTHLRLALGPETLDTLEALQHTGFYPVQIPRPAEADRFQGYPVSPETVEWHPTGLAYQGALRWQDGGLIFPGHYGLELLKDSLVLPLHRGFSHLSGGRLPSRAVPAGPPFETPEGQGVGRVLHHRFRWVFTPLDARLLAFHQHQLMHKPVYRHYPRPSLLDTPVDDLIAQAPRSLQLMALRWQPGTQAHELRLLNTGDTPLTLDLSDRWTWREVDAETGYTSTGKAIHFVNILPRRWVSLQAMLKEKP
jgi:hypothetical protein